MKIKILLFAQLQEALGGHRQEMEVALGTTAGEAAKLILSQERCRRVRGLPLRYAVNESFAGSNQRLSEGDTLALLTPVAGG